MRNARNDGLHSSRFRFSKACRKVSWCKVTFFWKFVPEIELLNLSKIIIIYKFSTFPFFSEVFKKCHFVFFHDFLKNYEKIFCEKYPLEMDFGYQFSMIKCNISILPLIGNFSGSKVTFFGKNFRIFFYLKNFY